MGASDDPRATAAPVALAADTVAVDTAVIMVATVARVAKEGIIEEETMVAASPPTTVEAVALPSTLTPIRTAVTMAVVAVVTDTATARRTVVVAAAAEIVEEGILFQMCTCSFIHSFIRHVPRNTYNNEDPTPIHIKKVILMNIGRK